MNDTADTAPLAVIATRIPYIDRRSLSEAWFSALHLASDGPSNTRVLERRVVGGKGGTVGAPTPCSSARAAANGPTPTAGRAVVASSRIPVALQDCGVRHPRDARVASVALATYRRARSYPSFRTSLSVGVNGARVRLLLRREGATLHVIALCRPEIAALVGRALIAADAHLRLHGESVRSSVLVEPSVVRA